MTMNDDKRPLTGIHGWLALLWFGLVIGGPISILAAVGNMPRSSSSAFIDVFSLAYLAFSIFSGVKLRSTVKPARIFLRVMGGIGILIVLIGVLLEASGDSKSAVEELASGFKVLLPSFIWLAYLHYSVRVKNTYPADFGRKPLAPPVDEDVVAKGIQETPL
jgi:hypothetical protein